MRSDRRWLILGMVAALLLALLPAPARAALPPGGTFIDDDGNTHEGDIEAIAAEGITKGCNPPFQDRYCPGDVVDRGAMAAFLRRALDLPASSTDHFVDDNGTLFEADINAIADAGITKGCNPPTNNLFCPNDTVKRDTMASFLARAFGHPSMVPPPRPPLNWEVVVSGLSNPVQVLAPTGEDRLLIAEQEGRIRRHENGSLSIFLDLTGPVVFGGERGLLSMALHPDYPTDRRLFVWYYGSGDKTYLVEYNIAADLKSAFSPRIILDQDQPRTNHNGGFLEFGADGYLYLGLGDGGGSNDQFETARNLGSLLGKMIRIDIDDADPGLQYAIPADNPYVGKAGRDEIWALGLRNPWRWSFDDGYMYIGDVGQNAREEIDVVPVAPVGYDFGWSRFEGSLCNPNDHDPSCSTAGLTFPLGEYGRSVGRTVTGGVVYRGPTVRSLAQYYLYADVFSGMVRGFRLENGKAVEAIDLTSRLGLGGIVDFEIDGDGEILVASLFDGRVYRLTGG